MQLNDLKGKEMVRVNLSMTTWHNNDAEEGEGPCERKPSSSGSLVHCPMDSMFPGMVILKAYRQLRLKECYD